MDYRHFDPAEATDVTADLQEARPEKNRLYRVGDQVYKAQGHWLPYIAKLPGQRRAEITFSVCDETGQARRDADGQVILSEPYVIVVSAGLPRSGAEQADVDTRRYVVGFHHIRNFWNETVPGIAHRAPEPPADDAGDAIFSDAGAALFGPTA